jgi:hypothetical protein
MLNPSWDANQRCNIRKLKKKIKKSTVFTIFGNNITKHVILTFLNHNFFKHNDLRESIMLFIVQQGEVGWLYLKANGSKNWIILH